MLLLNQIYFIRQEESDPFKNSDAYHREFIQRKLDEAGGNVSRAAELMGIDRSHLYRRMRALGISARGDRAGP